MYKPLRRAPSCARSAVALALLATSWVASSEAASPDPLPKAPHPIIIVDIDTLGAKHLGTYGYPRDTSPEIDAFAEQAIRFEWAFSQAPNTPPSQTSILTGLYPSTHGMIAKDDRVPKAVTTLAEALQAIGFRTAAFVDGGFMMAEFGIGQGFESYVVTNNNDKLPFAERPSGLKVIGPQVSRWLAEHAAENFLLLVHTYDVHWPYDAPDPYGSKFLDGLAPPSAGFQADAETLETLRRNKPQKLPDNDLEYAKARYDGGISYVDAWFGKFIEQLEELDLLDRATIVLLSDHGDEFQEHGSVGHDRLYATVTHVPFIIRLPGGVGARSVPFAVQMIDVMPTLLELVGAPLPAGLQGHSLLPLLSGRPGKIPIAVSESPFFGVRRAIAAGDYRLLLTEADGKVELYHFRNDPDEQNDLSASDPSTMERLRKGLANWQEMIERWPSYDESGAPLDPEALKNLRALGYID